MSSARSIIDITWMPKLLQLAQDIGTNTVDLNSAATEFDALLRELYLESAVLQEKRLEASRLSDNLIELQEVAEIKEEEYQAYRKEVLAKAELAISQGSNPNSHEAAELLKMEIVARKLREQVQNDQSRAVVLQNDIEEHAVQGLQALAGSSQLDQMTSKWQAMEKHRDELLLLLSDLNIQLSDGRPVLTADEEGSISSLFQYIDLLRASSWLADIPASQLQALQGDFVTELHQQLHSLISLGAIDSSLLFSEICILLAQRKAPCQLVFAAQPPTIEDLTEF